MQRTATQNLPDTEVIIMNLCSSLLAPVKKDGKCRLLAREVQDLLDRARDLNLVNKKDYLHAGALVAALVLDPASTPIRQRHFQ
ncbi:MAG: hypothetical protein ACYC4S_02980 [Rhodoferax sp.]